jgi:hypothetical protein
MKGFERIPVPVRGIEPMDIDSSKHFFGAFGNIEAAVSARYIVQFCQDRHKGWGNFTYADIDAYYRDKGRKDGFTFNRLIGMGYIHDNSENERYKPETIFQIDFRFVAKCYVAGLGQRFGDQYD